MSRFISLSSTNRILGMGLFSGGVSWARTLQHELRQLDERRSVVALLNDMFDVATELSPFVDRRILAGQDDHRHAARTFVGAQPFEELEAVHPRHGEIEQD